MLNASAKVLWVGLVALTAFGCGAEGSDDPNTGGTGAPVPGGGGGVSGLGAGGVAGGTTPAGTGGVVAPPAGMGGMAGVTPPAGTGGMVAPPAGMGGMMSMGGMGGMGGMSMGGMGGSTGMPGGEAQCLMDIMAAGTTVTACEMCLCKADKCQAELTALKGDMAGNALVKCSREKKCSGACCVCGAPCDPLGANYGMGMCIMEIEVAAGVTPGAGALANGGTVSMNCNAMTGPMTNSCARATRLGTCSAMKCMAECMPPACM